MCCRAPPPLQFLASSFPWCWLFMTILQAGDGMDLLLTLWSLTWTAARKSWLRSAAPLWPLKSRVWQNACWWRWQEITIRNITFLWHRFVDCHFLVERLWIRKPGAIQILTVSDFYQLHIQAIVWIRYSMIAFIREQWLIPCWWFVARALLGPSC